MSISADQVPAVLEYWFGSADPAAEVPLDLARWFRGGDEVDAEVRRRFLPTLEALAGGQGQDWRDRPAGRLAAVIVLDQFSRNSYRGTAQAFEQDPLALQLVLDGVDRGVDRAFGLHQRAFFYLPLEHSEDPAIQQRSIECYTRLRDAASPAQLEPATMYLDYAKRHKAIIDEFGRYPHRNEYLGRTTTHEEFAFLRQPGSSF